jgi:flagellar hook-associated protein 2
MAIVTSSLASGTTNLGISGLASGFDWQSLISQLVTVERAPEQLLRNQQTALQQQNSALGSLKTELGLLQGKAALLQDPSFFDSRAATTTNSALATATAAAGTGLGTYNFVVSQMASAAVLRGNTGAGAPLSPTDDVSALTLSAASFATAVTPGIFTVNGKQITITASDTLQSVFTQISTATGGSVAAAYSTAADKITLTSASEIILGSATDTSNFLQAAKLNNTGTGTISSAGQLGTAKLSGAMNQANLATAISDGGSGAGAFTINGVTINFSATADSLGDVIKRINDSTAGVVAAYDSVSNRFSLTDKAAGDVGIAVQDVTGNFLAATGLAGGTLNHGKNLQYTLNGGPQLTSLTNVIDTAGSGLGGLQVTVSGPGSFDVTVASDSNKIKTGITDFVTEYNKVQSLITTQTASSTDAKGKVTAGVLAGNQDTESLSMSLRDLVNSSATGLSGALQRLDSLGFVSNGHDDTLSTADLTGLDRALASNLSGVKDLFTHASTGLGVKLNDYLNRTIGDSGSLVTHQANLTSQSAAIDTQIANMEKQIQQYQQQLTNEFVAMETAQAQVNQQLTFLQQSFKSLSA